MIHRIVRKFAHALVALAGCLHLVGGHFGVMQAVAWAEMIVDYSAENGLADGLRMTFDGRHPCDRCSAIATAKRDRLPSPGEAPTAPRRDTPRADIQPCPPWTATALRKPRALPQGPPGFAEPRLPGARVPGAPETPPPRAA